MFRLLSTVRNMYFLRTVFKGRIAGGGGDGGRSCLRLARAAAKALNERGIKTTTGKAWTAVQIIRVRERLADRR